MQEAEAKTTNRAQVIEECAAIADQAAASAARWLPNPKAEAKQSIAIAIASAIRRLSN